MTRLISISLAGIFLVAAPALAQYQWRNVMIGGGGYVTGLVVHPNEQDLVYARTDIGGAYRYAPTQDQGRHWVPITDQFALVDQGRYAIESIAVDPNNVNVVYVAAGRYSSVPGEIYRSDSRGDNWVATGLASKSVEMMGNEPFRWTGERLAIDPNNSDVLYFGSRNDGLWTKSGPGGWSKVSPVPNGTGVVGVTAVTFDPRNPVGGKSQTIYAGVDGQGVYRTTNGGSSWSLMSGSPSQPRRIEWATNGTIYVSAQGGVHKYDGTWTNTTPSDGGGAGLEYAAIESDASDPDFLIVAHRKDGQRGFVWRSFNAGNTWETLALPRNTLDLQADVDWWESGQWSGSTAAITMDPNRPGRAYLTGWAGIWMTDAVKGALPMTWYTQEAGHEEVVPFSMATPPSGAAFFSAHADQDGMRHTNIYDFPEKKMKATQVNPLETLGIDYYEANPNYMVRVTKSRYLDESYVLFSEDNGLIWNHSTDWPVSREAHQVAASATDPENAVVIVRNSVPYFTRDGGDSWDTSSGAPSNTITTYWNRKHSLAADRVRTDTYYLYTAGTVYRSTNGGENFQTRATGLPVENTFHYVEAAPGMPDHVWVSLNWGGLHYSSDGGQTFEEISGISRSVLFGFGKPYFGSAYPAVFMFGRRGADSREYVYRSDDFGQTWVKINSDESPIGGSPTIMRGDRQFDGRVFVGSEGRGNYFGEPTFVRTSLRVNLQGPYESPEMTPGLNSILPATQPFDVAPWNYQGKEGVNPTDDNDNGRVDFFEFYQGMIDWVLVELRTGPDGPVVSRRAALLRKDGTIMETDGKSRVSFEGASSGNYHVVIRHRNSLAVRSLGSVAITR